VQGLGIIFLKIIDTSKKVKIFVQVKKVPPPHFSNGPPLLPDKGLLLEKLK
jgi:hypothetical protein